MPTQVTFIVKRGSSILVHEHNSIAKKQRTTPIPSIRFKREGVNAVVEEVTIKAEEIDESKGELVIFLDILKIFLWQK
jgi:hypothetical protein